MLHIVEEARVLFDPIARLDELKNSFVYKDSYAADVETGCRIIAAVVSLPQEKMNRAIIRRYFWGMRTALMAASANERVPLFSAADLEARFAIVGLERHISLRGDARPGDCREFGLTIYQTLMGTSLPNDQRSIKQNLEFIMGLGGVATATAGEIIYGIGEEL